MSVKIGVIGLGYVGLPLALAFAKKFPGTVGFDISSSRVKELVAGEDSNNEESSDKLKNSKLTVTSKSEDLRPCNFFVIGVPTPVDLNRNPDFEPLRSACQVVGSVMQKGSIVCFESTVYPGVTEDICGPWLAAASGFSQGRDFKLAYSPERINPGDKEHTLERIKKIVSGEDPQTLEKASEIYGAIIEAGIHKASSIKVAEAAKVIENTQRDLNIALMNELALIFDRMNISTKEVLEAAGTKWNFVKFSPGLVGGHCIGVDPYYLTTKAQQLGYHPQVILAGRRINDDMGFWVAQRVIKLMVNTGIQVKGARVGVLGITFKENVSDLRNSRVPDIVHELRQFGALPLVYDPLAESEKAFEEYRIKTMKFEELHDLDALILAVNHKEFLEMSVEKLTSGLRPKGVFADVKSVFNRSKIPNQFAYWSL